jgi:hypothetical protein
MCSRVKAPPAGATAEGLETVRTRHVVIRYTTLRLAIFLAVLIVLRAIVAIAGYSLAGASSLLYLALVALLVSGVISFFALNRQRDAVSETVVERGTRLRAKLDANAAMEDDD